MLAARPKTAKRRGTDSTGLFKRRFTGWWSSRGGNSYLDGGTSALLVGFQSRARKGFYRNARGIFPNKFPSEFCCGLFVDLGGGGHFPWTKSREEKKNIRQNSNQNLGASRPKSTLQRSGLDNLASETLFIMEFRSLEDCLD